MQLQQIADDITQSFSSLAGNAVATLAQPSCIGQSWRRLEPCTLVTAETLWLVMVKA